MLHRLHPHARTTSISTEQAKGGGTLCAAAEIEGGLQSMPCARLLRDSGRTIAGAPFRALHNQANHVPSCQSSAATVCTRKSAEKGHAFMSFQFERKLFLALLVAATMGCLFPIWAFTYLPMQDLPQHLFLTKAVQDFANPAFDLPEYYTVNQRVGPYVLFYWLTGLLAQLTNVQIAGKLFVSVYAVLFSLFILAKSRDEKTAVKGGVKIDQGGAGKLDQ
ncbi:MAG: hypothetical protein O3A53_06845, partial [Acidobacteria bacterium]|nr:hypothetical protein [Acidobacteriota bacterium]